MDRINPFTPGPGLMPPYLAGREEQQTVFSEALQVMKGRGTGNIVVMYGPRGMGKTVLLEWLGEQCEQKGIVPLLATPATELETVADMSQLLLPSSWLPDEVSARLGKTLTAKWTSPATKKQGDFTTHLIEACKQEPRVLLLDEAHTLKPELCKKLLNMSQVAARKAPFLLILAGTPGLEPFLRTVSATFVERAKKVGVGFLGESEAGQAIHIPLENEGIKIANDVLADVVKDAQCYPFFLQLWGEAIWKTAMADQLTELNREQVQQAAENVQKQRRSFYQSRYRALSQDKELLKAAVAVGKAFEGKGQLFDSAITAAIESGLSGGSVSANESSDKALALNEELNRIDYIWYPPDSKWVVPGIPSFMNYVGERFLEESAASS
ncbi:MAG: AAA family ATPase [Pseudomonadales bacterium]